MQKGEVHGVIPFFFFAGLGDRPTGVLSLLLRGGMCLPPGFLHECHQPRHPAVLGQCNPRWQPRGGDTGGPGGSGQTPAGPEGEVDLGLGTLAFESV